MKRLLYLILFLVSVPGYAVTITAAAGGGNWSNTATWVGAATPTAANDVLLAITSGSVTVDVGTALALSVTATAFTNNLNFAAGQTLTVSGNVQLDTTVSGMTLNGTGVLAINAVANLLSSGQTFTGSLFTNLNNLTITLADTWTVLGNLTCIGNGTIFNGNTLKIGGSFDLSGVTNGTTTFSGTTIILLNGSGKWASAQGGSSSSQLPACTSNVTLNTSGSITLGNINYGGGSVNYTTGAIVNTGSNLYLTTSCGLNTSTMHWNNIYFPTRPGVGVTLLSNLVADGTIGSSGVTLPSVNGTPITVIMSGAFNTSCAGLEVIPGGCLSYTAGQTITVSKYMLTGANPAGNVISGNSAAGICFNSKIISGTSSSACFLKYTGGASGSLLFNADFVDVTAVNPVTVWTEGRGNVLTRTSNITTGTFTPASGSSRGYFY